MSDSFYISEIPKDPFKDGTLSITEYANANQNLVGEVYHKKVTIKFSKTDTDADILGTLSGSVYTYINTKVMIPTAPNSVTNNNVGLVTPTYSAKTERNDFNYISISQQDEIYISDGTLPQVNISAQPLTERERMPFFGKQANITEQRNLVFSRDNDMSGFPISDLSQLRIYNEINMTHEEGQQFVAKIPSNTGLGVPFSIYERLMVLVGHYSNAITTLTGDPLTLNAIIDQYDYPFPTDAYFIVSNEPAASVDLDLSFNQIEKDYLQAIRTTISANSMNYQDIFKEFENPNEYVFYRVEKWFRSTPLGIPDQVFFIPATNNNKRFIDTQIKEKTEYYYRVTVYYAVIGQQYFFSDVVDNEDGTGECIAQVRPKINFYSMVSFEGKLSIFKPPPLPPHVSFHNKISSDGMVKIYLEKQEGQITTPEIEVTPSISNIIASNYIVTDPVYQLDNVQFAYTPHPAKFEIFRLPFLPLRYTQFQDYSIGMFENKDKTESMAILDKIRPNKKYYYTFRSYNDQGSFSNPTPVFEVELLKDADETRVLVNTVLINEDVEPIGSNEHRFRRLLQINVNQQQLEFGLDNVTGANGEIATFENKLNLVQLGYAQDLAGELLEKIWGRKFKFRVRSKDSGKMIDLNIKVNLIKEES